MSNRPVFGLDKLISDLCAEVEYYTRLEFDVHLEAAYGIKSPIEKLWWLAFGELKKKLKGTSVLGSGPDVIVGDGDEWVDPSRGCMTIGCQVVVFDNWPIDFVVATNNDGAIFRFAIECDGHDFHERTKEQAVRDRSRDRELQARGYRIFRFTGSEIFKDPIRCASEVATAIALALRGKI